MIIRILEMIVNSNYVILYYCCQNYAANINVCFHTLGSRSAYLRTNKQVTYTFRFCQYYDAVLSG